jgi:GxxExxY protein
MKLKENLRQSFILRTGYALQRRFYEVYNVLGPGFREETYRQVAARELRSRNSVETEKYYDIPYKGDDADRYRADFVVDDKIIVELRAARLQVERRIV